MVAITRCGLGVAVDPAPGGFHDAIHPNRLRSTVNAALAVEYLHRRGANAGQIAVALDLSRSTVWADLEGLRATRPHWPRSTQEGPPMLSSACRSIVAAVAGGRLPWRTLGEVAEALDLDLPTAAEALFVCEVLGLVSPGRGRTVRGHGADPAGSKQLHVRLLKHDWLDGHREMPSWAADTNPEPCPRCRRRYTRVDRHAAPDREYDLTDFLPEPTPTAPPAPRARPEPEPTVTLMGVPVVLDRDWPLAAVVRRQSSVVSEDPAAADRISPLSQWSVVGGR